MEKKNKPQNLFVPRNRVLTAAAAIIFTALGAIWAVLMTVVFIKRPPEADLTVLIIVCIVAVTSILLYLGIMNIYNLFFPYLLTADEKGVYNYSGFFHFGFIAWKDIQSFYTDPAWLDLLDESVPSLKIYVRDFDNYKNTLSFYRKWLLFWSGSNIKIYTFTSQIKRKQILMLLDEMLKYYGTPEDIQVDNG